MELTAHLLVFRGVGGGYDVAYIHTPTRPGTSKLAAKFDTGIGVVNTARHWNTVMKMHSLAHEIEAK